MTGPESDTDGTKPISVAELLARNGTLGAPAVTRRRRRRRGDGDTVTVAELTGEIPVIRDDDEHQVAGGPDATGANGVAKAAPADPPVIEAPATGTSAQVEAKTAYWSEPEPRWPKSPPRASRPPGPERSAYPRPVRDADVRPVARAGQPEAQAGAEDMSPDPVDQYADAPVDVMDSDVREAEPEHEDSAYVRSYLDASPPDSDATLFGGQTLADELARRRGEAKADGAGRAVGIEDDHLEGGAARSTGTAPDAPTPPGRLVALWRGTFIVVQSILAVAFGAGLFIAFDELWRWNSMVALVLSVLVILGLVVSVRVVRKTEDIASTLIAVAVGALITLGPLALSLQSG
jgi:hypothetical protein